MPDFSKCLFFDLEYNPESRDVREYGYVLGEEQVRAKSPARIEKAADSADFLVGHNVLRHDAPILRSFFSIDFPNVKALDTLMLSSLLFPREPYHKLRKEYLQDEEGSSDPLKDALLCKRLLEDCIVKWPLFPWQLQFLLTALLSKQPGFAPFFELVEKFSFIEMRLKRKSVFEWLEKFYGDKICLQKNYKEDMQAYPIEWSYLLTLFYEEGPSDFVPFWVRVQYPHLETILQNRRMVNCGNPDCRYCSTQLNSVKQLSKWFGFPGFRSFDKNEKIPLQQQVVESAMKGESLLAVFPTGGGKSMTFQLPALIAGEGLGALTVVISPIQALMKDQVDVLEKRRQIGCSAYINSMLSPLERKDVFERVYNGEKNILYISPESLRSNSIFNLLLHRRIARIVIDEAHCFSCWGHDFRVDYLYLADFIKDLQIKKKLEKNIPVSCFTATAKHEVVEGICSYFKERLNLELVRFVSPARRTNLTYGVLESSVNPNERRKQLMALLRQHQGPKIVYANKVKTTASLAAELHDRGFASACYNGKMESEKKMMIQDQFQNSEIDIMVATTAFGMGVDKDDVELVAHYEISSSLENYVQEAGRAGRNPELQASCVALYNPKDLNTNFQILQQSKLSAKEIGDVWKVLKTVAGSRNSLIMSALEIADKCGWTEKETDSSINSTKVKLAVLVLEEQGFLKRKRNRTQMYGTSISVESVNQAREKLGSDNVEIAGSAANIAFRIIRHIVSKRWTRSPECAMDELTVDLGLTLEETNLGLRLLRSLRLLKDDDDWSVKLQRIGNYTPRSLLAAAEKLQTALLETCEGKDVGDRFTLDLIKLNTRIKQDFDNSNVASSRRNLFVLRGLLRYWAHESVAEIHLIEAGRQIYQIEFIVEPEKIKSNLESNWKLFEKTVETLVEMQKTQSRKHGGMVWFSLNGLIEKMYGEAAIGDLNVQKRLEYALLFLHLIGSITLDHGLVVFYTGLVMEIEPQARSRKFTEKDFQILKTHYDHKAESIHIVGEYARLMMQNQTAAQELLDDYFSMDLESFRMKHMFGERKEEAVSESLRAKIEDVNEEQRKVIKSRRKHILVGAGPGSGKTHLLVHKVASLLWIEEAKPETILCLTYTRAACRELKKRLFDLAGPLAAKVVITTFHSLAFSTLGIQGNKKDLERSGNNEKVDIIARAAEMLESGEDCGVGAPAVILVDEFQDLSEGEYRLLRALYDLGDKDPRVIVVGDDDQSIFSFRGSSSEYFRKFEDEFPLTEKHFLITNYRSVGGLVRANDKLLDLMKERVKAGSKQRALKQNDAKIIFYSESNKAKAAFAAAEILSKRFKAVPSESYCILTRDNAEAFLTAAKLEENEVGYKFLKGCDRDKCTIENTREILGFKNCLEENASENRCVWSSLEFRQIADKYKNGHGDESDFELLNAVVDDFLEAETACGEDEITLGNFVQYLSEVSYSDLGQKYAGSVSVGTMHSSKGLEWDHVILALGDWNLVDEDEKKTQDNYRLLYVAATRAKKTLLVLGDEMKLPVEWIAHFEKRGNINDVKLPHVLHLETGLSDLNLGHLLENEKNGTRVHYVQKKFETMALGTPFDVKYHEQFQRFNLNLNGRLIAAFSKDFSKNISYMQKYGFKPIAAKLIQLCRWTSDDNQEIWVPLFRVEFAR